MTTLQKVLTFKQPIKRPT